MRTCKDLCQLYKIFSDKALHYEDGVRCSICERWIKYPEVDIVIVCMPNASDPNYQYHDIEGKRTNVKVLVPITKLRRSIRCKCCETQCRASSPSSNTKLQKKIFNTFKALQESDIPRAKRAVSNKILREKKLEQLKSKHHYEDYQGVFDVFGEIEI